MFKKIFFRVPFMRYVEKFCTASQATNDSRAYAYYKLDN